MVIQFLRQRLPKLANAKATEITRCNDVWHTQIAVIVLQRLFMNDGQQTVINATVKVYDSKLLWLMIFIMDILKMTMFKLIILLEYISEDVSTGSYF